MVRTVRRFWWMYSSSRELIRYSAIRAARSSTSMMRFTKTATAFDIFLTAHEQGRRTRDGRLRPRDRQG